MGNSKEERIKAKKKVKGNGFLSWLKEKNDLLEEIPKSVGASFDDFFLSGEEMTQDAVDVVCTWFAWGVNITVERLRQKVVKDLHSHNEKVEEIMGPVRVLVEIFKNPLGVLKAIANAVKQIIKSLIGPYWYLVEFFTELAKEIYRLAENLAALQSMTPPDPPSPNIDFHAFNKNLKIGRMGMDIILEDPETMPTPEEKFPEPFNPFSFRKNKEAGMSFWASATKHGREDFSSTWYDMTHKIKKNEQI